MSRPGSLPGTSGPGPAPRASAPLRVTAERLTADEVRAADLADAARRAAMTGPDTMVLAHPMVPVGTAIAPTTPAALVPVAAPARRSGFAELLALISGRRRTGRHRPDCVRRQSWSMFSPHRSARRRRRFRS